MNHDAAMAVVEIKDGIGKILRADHAERYSKKKSGGANVARLL